MSEKLRSVNTRFWDDPFVENLNPTEKLLFLYLLTNPLTNLLGIYEITLKRICYDTGLKLETVQNGFESFAKGKKAYYTKDNYVILPNWLKNQKLNKNMKVAVAKEFNLLPKNIKDSILTNGSERLTNDSEGFRMVMECLDKYEIEIEIENEIEIRIDYESLIENYHTLCPKMSKVQALNKTRKGYINARVGEYGLEKVISVFRIAGQSDFLNGKNDKAWKADFEWILRPENFLKVLEGKYINKKPDPVIPVFGTPGLKIEDVR